MPDNPEIWKAVAMQDHFEKIQKLPDKIDGVPNFRRVPGYKVSAHESFYPRARSAAMYKTTLLLFYCLLQWFRLSLK